MRKLFIRWLSIFANRGSISLEFPLMAAYVVFASTNPTSELAIFALVYSLFTWLESPFMMSDVVMVKSLHAGASYINGLAHTLALSIIPMLIVSGSWGISDAWLPLLSEGSEGLWSIALPYLVGLSLMLPVSGVRRSLNGVATFHHKEVMLHTGMWLKAIVIVAVLFFSYVAEFTSILAAILALVAGISIETIYLYIKVRKIENGRETSCNISFHKWLEELIPFALISFVSLGIGAIVTITLSFGPSPELAVAIFSLLNGLITIFKHAPMSIQSIWVDTLNKDIETTNKMNTFFLVVLVLTIMAMGLYYCFFHSAYIHQFNGITTQAADTAIWTFVLLSTSVILTFPVIYYRGKLIYENNKSALNISTLIEFSTFTVVIFALLITSQINSAVACSIGIALGRLSSLMMMKFTLSVSVKTVTA